jgi:RNA polymerase sigma-70 factor (ECF subfamily)
MEQEASPMSTGPSGSWSPQAAFEEEYARHSQEVWALAYARLLNADLALDLMQETFLRLWKHGRSGEVILNVRGWLLRVVRNLAEDQAKSSFRKNGTQASETMERIASGMPSPQETLETAETTARVRAELQRMPPSDREILTLRYALEYPVNRIADVLGITQSAVHMRLSRARHRLAERVKSEGVADGREPS